MAHVGVLLLHSLQGGWIVASPFRGAGELRHQAMLSMLVELLRD